MDGAFFMVNWESVIERVEWEDLSGSLGTVNYLHMWGWGEYRSHFGWEPVRCVARDADGLPVALVQMLVRRFPGRVGMVWVPGGVIGDVSIWAGTLLDCVKQLTGLQYVFLRINDLRSYSAADVVHLHGNGWRRSPQPLTSGLSLLWKIDNSNEERRAALSKNWRHNLNRAEKAGLYVEKWVEPDLEEIVLLYKEMERLKTLPEQISESEVEKMLSAMAENILCYRCLDSDGQLIALRACALVGDRAWDLMAAAGEKARKVYASYITLWRLVEECHHRGVRFYDLAGIDPHGNKGVWYFKRGTGAVSHEYLGEWEIATSGFLRRGINFALSLKGGRA
jgi:hypothetical protein